MAPIIPTKVWACLYQNKCRSSPQGKKKAKPLLFSCLRTLLQGKAHSDVSGRHTCGISRAGNLAQVSCLPNFLELYLLRAGWPGIDRELTVFLQLTNEVHPRHE